MSFCFKGWTFPVFEEEAMPYKPNFCCQCGEKIERISWSFLTSRRFCELCETELGVYDKIPLIVVGAGVLFGIFGIGMYFRAPEKTLDLSPNQLVSSQSNANKNETKSNISSAAVQPENSALTKTDAFPATQNATVKKEPAAEAVYFCGAPTKKGTPCSRRVKGGGRCWQHAGQTAMVAQEKLRIGND